MTSAIVIANGAIPYFAAQIEAGVLLLIPVIIIEAFFLKLLLKQKFSHTLKFCAVANLASTFAGIPFIFTGMPYFSLSVMWNIILTLILLFILFALSVWIEYSVYKNHWKEISRQKLFKAVRLVNIITYIPLVILAVYIYLSHARSPEKARRIACLANLKQIGLAIHLYADDYKGFAPDKTGQKGMEQLIKTGFVQDDKIYWCPSCNSFWAQKENRIDYNYRGGLNLKLYVHDASKIPVVWDKPGNHKDYGGVLYLDGHVKCFVGLDWMEQAGIKGNDQVENSK
jgi:prepilin-type processing-associated H-X9-DG protein